MSQQVLTDPFALLGVTDSSTDEEIEKAWKARMRKAHPDAGGSEDEAKMLNWARDTLLDPVRRFDFVMARVQERYGRYARTSTAQGNPSQSKAEPTSDAPPRQEQTQKERPRQEEAPREEAPKYTWKPPAQSPGRNWWVGAYWVLFVGVLVALSWVPMGELYRWPSVQLTAYEQAALVLALFGWAGAFRSWRNTRREAGRKPGLKQVLRATWLVVVLLAMSTAGLLWPDQYPGASSTVHVSSSSAVPGTRAGAGECTVNRDENGRTAPDPHCSPGAIFAGASRASTCRGSDAPFRPGRAERDSAKDSVYRAYSVSGKTVGDFDFVVPPELGGVWHMQNLWVGKSTASRDTVQRALRLLCSSNPPVTYREVLKAAATNSLDRLVRRYA